VIQAIDVNKGQETTQVSEHQIVTREKWTAAKNELLAMEKEHTRRGDELARLRRQLPWTRIDKDYVFDTAAGSRTLTELFDGRSQLVIYNFMFGPDYDAGCPVCSSIADSFNGVVEHLKARDVTMMCVSRAPIEKLLAYRKRMGWSFNWASSYASDFNFDFERSVAKETVASWFGDGLPDIPARLAAECGTDVLGYLSEGPGLSVFAQSDGEVYLTYSTGARGLEPVMVYYGILDRVPQGRDEGEPADPTWVRRHDEFANAG
jgi:predicted dithiol-disulfide oxidoreductase (DUF899 family)